VNLRTALLLLLVGLAGCPAPPVDTPPRMTVGGPATILPGPGASSHKVDLLLVLANSPTMQPKLDVLTTSLGELAAQLTAAPSTQRAWYHIGVITSDLGAGAFELPALGCHPDGDGARLQPIARAAAPSCQAPTGGVPFLDLNQLDGTSNLPAGQDLTTTLACLTAVGHDGCTFQQPLEAAYRALHDPSAANQGFLRDDALLVVLWVDDRDDCSVAPESDLFDPAKTDAYGPLLPFRCVQRAIVCGDPPAPLPAGPSNGNLAPCLDADAATNPLFPVAKYINFFTKPRSLGGVKVDPSDVVLAGSSGPASWVETLLADPATAAGPYTPCSGPPDGTSCALVEQHACVQTVEPTLTGDPAVRLQQVLSSARHEQLTSICDTTDREAVDGLVNLVISLLPPTP
jgi:hypothetical protein